MHGILQVATTLLKHCEKALLALDDMEEVVHYLKAEVKTTCTTCTDIPGLHPPQPVAFVNQHQKSRMHVCVQHVTVCVCVCAPNHLEPVMTGLV